MTPHDAVAIYGSVWAEPDEGKRLELLERCWAPDGVYLDPSGRAEGREELAKHIGGFQQMFADHVIEATTGVDAHDGYLRFGWRMLGPDRNVLMEGVDFGEYDDAGRIKRIVGFFGPWPPLEETT